MIFSVDPYPVFGFRSSPAFAFAGVLELLYDFPDLGHLYHDITHTLVGIF